MSQRRHERRGPRPAWVYLNDCNELVWQHAEPLMQSLLVRARWKLPPGGGQVPKEELYGLLLDAAVLGATARTIKDNRDRFGIDEADCVKFCQSAGIYGEKRPTSRLALPNSMQRTTVWICWWAMGSSRPHRDTSIDVPKGRGPELWDAMVDLWRQARRPTT